MGVSSTRQNVDLCADAPLCSTSEQAVDLLLGDHAVFRGCSRPFLALGAQVAKTPPGGQHTRVLSVEVPESPRSR